MSKGKLVLWSELTNRTLITDNTDEELKDFFHWLLAWKLTQVNFTSEEGEKVLHIDIEFEPIGKFADPQGS